MEARGEIVPYDEPPTDPRGVVKNDVEFAVSSSLSENRLHLNRYRMNQYQYLTENKICIVFVSMILP